MSAMNKILEFLASVAGPVGPIVRNRWRLLAALAAAGAALGVGTAVLASPGHTTSSAVLVPGTHDPSELRTEARIATSSAVLDRAADVLGWGVPGAGLRDAVSADTVDGNVIEIAATADTPEKARQLADAVAHSYVTFAARFVGPSVTGQVGAATRVVINEAPLPTGTAAPVWSFGAAGAALFFVAGVLGHLVAARADRRVDDEQEMAAALDSPIVVGVDVPRDTLSMPRGWLGRQVGAERPWTRRRVLPTRASEQYARYRRALAAVPGDGGSPHQLVIVIPAGDTTARRAADRLAMVAEAEAQPRAVKVRVAAVSADRPSLRGNGGVPALVVVSAGTRTAWQLVCLAEACGESGHDVVGAVLAHPVAPDLPRRTGRNAPARATPLPHRAPRRRGRPPATVTPPRIARIAECRAEPVPLKHRYRGVASG